MKVLLVCGAFPPKRCGVGEYVSRLARSLARVEGMQVEVLTSVAGPEDGARDDEVGVSRVVRRWSLGQLPATLRTILRSRPDIVHVQYPSALYNGPLASVLPAFLNLCGVRVVQTWHEHYSEDRSVAWPNLLGLDALVFVRPDLPKRLPRWVRARISRRPTAYIRNAPTIPPPALAVQELEQLKQRISAGIPIVAFFGFAHPNKGVERLFDIADPSRHHVLLMCDLDPANAYHASLLTRARASEWEGRVTVTGFQGAQEVAEFLAIVDALVFPFPGGSGEWNTSLQAAQAAGAFSIATTRDTGHMGYHARSNTYFVACDDLQGMRSALEMYIGHRIPPAALLDPWQPIAAAHARLYAAILGSQAA